MRTRKKALSVLACAAMMVSPISPAITNVHAEEAHDHDHEHVHTEVVLQTSEDQVIRTQLVRHLSNSVMDGYQITFDGKNFAHVISEGKHNFKLDESKHEEPTETEPGSDTYTCSCGQSYTVTLPETGASYTLVETKDPTCTEDGYNKYVDEENGKEYKDVIPKTGHIYHITSFKDPTCTESGSVTYTCEVCPDKFIDEKTGEETPNKDKTITEKIDPIGHKFSDWQVQKKATCTEKGTLVRECEYCGEKEYQDTSALGHTYELVESVDPTCEKAGHKTYRCSRCGDSYTNTIPALGHKMSEWHTAQDPTCEENGILERVCLNGCGLVEHDTIDKLGHNYVKKSHVDPTCTKEGYDLYVCTICGDSYKETIPAKGHNYKKTVVAPTCTTDGYTEYTCTECGHTYKADRTSALGHSYQEHIVRQATCTEDGLKVFRCTRCGDEYSEVIKASGHDYEITSTSATCTKKGTTVYKCKKCGDTYTVAGKALGHAWEAKVTSATCTKSGYTTYTCTRCGESYIGNKTKALGHDWKVKEKVDPTKTKAGHVIYECSRCGATYTQILDAGTSAEEVELLVNAEAAENSTEEDVDLIHDGNADEENTEIQYDEDGNVVAYGDEYEGVGDGSSGGSEGGGNKSKAPYIAIPIAAAAAIGGVIAFKKKKQNPSGGESE